MDKIETNKAEIEQRLEGGLDKALYQIERLVTTITRIHSVVGTSTEAWKLANDVLEDEIKDWHGEPIGSLSRGRLIDALKIIEETEAENARLRALLHRWAVWGEGQEHDLEVDTRRELEGEK